MMIALALALAPAGGLHVELKPEARACGTELVVAEVAEVRGADAELVQRVRALALGYTPAPGFSRRLDRWSLQRELAQAFPGVELSFAGTEACRVVPQVERVRSTDLVACARAELAAAYGAADVSYSVQGTVGDLEVPVGRSGRSLRARLDARAARPGLVSVPIEVLVDGEAYRTVWTTWAVEAWREAPVLVRDVAQGEELSAALFERRRVKVGVGPEPTYLTEAAAEGGVAVRALPAGSVVQGRDVRRPLLVRRGDTVQLRVTKGPITATSTAVAAEDGYLGDAVRVVTSGQRELQARILGRELVAIELSPRR